MKHLTVAIDGPSGAGKSTIARAVASALGIIYVDTGALYRAIALATCRAGIGDGDTAGICALLTQLSISLRYQDGQQRVLLGGEDVSDAIRTPEVSRRASIVSAVPEVRAYLLEMQRDLARENGVVMDGRDIGTVILPQADVKIFLTASDEARAERRFRELAEKGQKMDFAQVLADMRRRDAQDAGRAAAPLRRAEDAVLLDTSEMDLAQSIAAVRRIIAGKQDEAED